MKTSSFNDSFISFRQQFKGEYVDRQALAAFLYLMDSFANKERKMALEKIVGEPCENKLYLQEKITECKAILKRTVRMSSAFRDHLKLPLIVRMALAEDSEEYLQGVLKVYETVKPSYFTGSGQRLITAMTIYENTPPDYVDYVCERTYKIYDKMKKEHPMLTGQEDMAFASLIAMDGEDVDDVVVEMEECFRILKKAFVSKQSPMQNVSHVLSMTSEAPEVKAKKYIALHKALASGAHKNGQGPLLTVLAVLSILDLTVEESAREVERMYGLLKRVRSLGRKFERVDSKLIACALVAMMHLPEDHVVIHNVQSGFLKAILRMAIISALVVNQSALASNIHK